MDLIIDLIVPDIQRVIHWTLLGHAWTSPDTSDFYVHNSRSAEIVLDRARRVFDELLQILYCQTACGVEIHRENTDGRHEFVTLWTLLIIG